MHFTSTGNGWPISSNGTITGSEKSHFQYCVDRSFFLFSDSGTSSVMKESRYTDWSSPSSNRGDDGSNVRGSTTTTADAQISPMPNSQMTQETLLPLLLLWSFTTSATASACRSPLVCLGPAPIVIWTVAGAPPLPEGRASCPTGATMAAL